MFFLPSCSSLSCFSLTHSVFFFVSLICDVVGGRRGGEGTEMESLAGWGLELFYFFIFFCYLTSLAVLSGEKKSVGLKYI